MTAKINKIEQNARNAYKFQQKSTKCQTIMAIDSNELREADTRAVYFSGFLFLGCHGQVGGTRFQVGMTVDEIIPVLYICT